MLSKDIKSIIHALERRLLGDGQIRHPREGGQAFISNLNSCTQQPEALGGARPLRKVHRGTPSAKGKSRPTDERFGYERGEAKRPCCPMWYLGRGGCGCSDSAYGRASALSAESEPDAELAATKKSYGRRVLDIDKEL